MSVFSVAGNADFVIGPLLVAAVLAAFSQLGPMTTAHPWPGLPALLDTRVACEYLLARQAQP